MAELGCIFNNMKTKYTMKKVIAIVAIATLAACGGASTTATTDSTATTVDSAAVVTDSTTAVVDTTVTK
jgi:uncharacterized lipoprotein YajG